MSISERQEIIEKAIRSMFQGAKDELSIKSTIAAVSRMVQRECVFDERRNKKEIKLLPLVNRPDEMITIHLERLAEPGEKIDLGTAMKQLGRDEWHMAITHWGEKFLLDGAQDLFDHGVDQVVYVVEDLDGRLTMKMFCCGPHGMASAPITGSFDSSMYFAKPYHNK